MRSLLFKDKRFQEIGNMIKNLWNKRRYIIETSKKKTGSTVDNPPIKYHRQKDGLSDPGPDRKKYGHRNKRARCKSSER